MREIKFRAWDKEENKIVTVNGICWRNGTVNDINADGSFHEPAERYILMQYTGLKDKNGRDIYDGDILRSLGNKNVVMFIVQFGHRDNKFSWGVKSVKTEASYELDDSCGERMEVVGNIYENPEL